MLACLSVCLSRQRDFNLPLVLLHNFVAKSAATCYYGCMKLPFFKLPPVYDVVMPIIDSIIICRNHT